MHLAKKALSLSRRFLFSVIYHHQTRQWPSVSLNKKQEVEDDTHLSLSLACIIRPDFSEGKTSWPSRFIFIEKLAGATRLKRVHFPIELNFRTVSKRPLSFPFPFRRNCVVSQVSLPSKHKKDDANQIWFSIFLIFVSFFYFAEIWKATTWPVCWARTLKASPIYESCKYRQWSYVTFLAVTKRLAQDSQSRQVYFVIFLPCDVI